MFEAAFPLEATLFWKALANRYMGFFITKFKTISLERITVVLLSSPVYRSDILPPQRPLWHKGIVLPKNKDFFKKVQWLFSHLWSTQAPTLELSPLVNCEIKMKKYFKCSKIKILSSLDICWRSQIFDAWCGWKIKTWYGKVCEMHKNAHEIYFLPSQPIETPLGKKYYTYIPSAKRRREAKHPYLLTCQLVFFWKKTSFFPLKDMPNRIRRMPSPWPSPSSTSRTSASAAPLRRTASESGGTPQAAWLPRMKRLTKNKFWTVQYADPDYLGRGEISVCVRPLVLPDSRFVPRWVGMSARKVSFWDQNWFF